jgi:hypothetical protein
MTKDTLSSLSTGDDVRNVLSGEDRIVIAIPTNDPRLISIEQMKAVEEWELVKSRFTMTKEELAAIKKYHEDIAEQMKKQK